jgi:quercetin dioxygenase-like cupin family protein
VSESVYPSAVGSVVLFENARVRVWEMTLQPGDQCDYHQHHHDHVILYPEAGTMRGQELGQTDWGLVQDAEPGFVLYRTVGHAAPLTPHRIKNLSDVPVVHYIIELLDESPSAETLPWEHNDRGRFGSVPPSE